MRITKILMVPSVKILLFMGAKGDVRYTDLAKLIASRGVLSNNLKSLEKEELLKRTVINTKPIKTYYSLSEKGKKVASCFNDVKACFPEQY